MRGESHSAAAGQPASSPAHVDAHASGEGRDFRLITCIMPAGRGREVLNRLRDEWQSIDVAFHHARGAGARRSRRGSLHFQDREVARVLVRAADADAIFEFLFRAAGIGEPQAGMIFMTRAGRAHPMLPPVEFGAF